MSNITRSPHYGELQELVDKLFRDNKQTTALDALVMAESYDFPPDLLEVIELLPPGPYTRQRLCTQLNSILNAHTWSQTYGTVE